MSERKKRVRKRVRNRVRTQDKRKERKRPGWIQTRRSVSLSASVYMLLEEEARCAAIPVAALLAKLILDHASANGRTPIPAQEASRIMREAAMRRRREREKRRAEALQDPDLPDGGGVFTF